MLGVSALAGNGLFEIQSGSASLTNQNQRYLGVSALAATAYLESSLVSASLTHTLRGRTRTLPMANYRRWFVPGGTFFFTCVTHLRAQFLTEEAARNSLREAFTEIQKRFPFEIVAIVLLPDHFHTVWSLPPGDDRYPTPLAAD
jgi:hypothetical protein